jgi:hypothetical protein
LQNPAVVESRGPQAFDIVLPDVGGILGQLYYVVNHHPLLRRDGSGGVIVFQRRD